jgi:3-phenylpropionate/trans-cinnamate dioxygenase ferredoxin subunit
MQSAKKYKWVKLAENKAMIDWQENNMCVVELDGKKLTIASREEHLFAFAHKCPHAGGIMAEGCLDAAGNAVCPLHRYKFNISNGRNTSGEGYFLKIYLVECRPDGVFIGFEEKGFLNWL